MRDTITLNELKVLSALILKEKYGLEIIKSLKEDANTTVYLGSLYNILSRLQKKGLVTCRWGEDTPERGGNRRKYYNLTGLGEKVLREEQYSFSKLWDLRKGWVIG